MEKEKPSAVSPILKWAFINLLIQITLVYMFQYIGIETYSSLRFLAYIPMLVCLLLLQRESVSRPTEEIITIRRGIEIALGYSIVAGFLFAIFTYIYLSTLNPQILQADLARAALEMQQRGMDKKQITQAVEIVRSTRLLFGASGKLMAYVFLCIPFGALGSVLLKRKKADFDYGAI